MDNSGLIIDGGGEQNVTVSVVEEQNLFKAQLKQQTRGVYVDAKIKEISNIGNVKIQFDDNMLIPDNISIIN